MYDDQGPMLLAHLYALKSFVAALDNLGLQDQSRHSIKCVFTFEQQVLENAKSRGEVGRQEFNTFFGKFKMAPSKLQIDLEGKFMLLLLLFSILPFIRGSQGDLQYKNTKLVPMGAFFPIQTAASRELF